MKYKYARIDLLTIIELSTFGLISDNDTYTPTIEWIKGLSDVEYRDDYQCFFVLKGSKSHTAITMKLGDVFD
jgi:hypothetical protein